MKLSRTLRILLVVAFAAASAGACAAMFWYQDWRYSLPTPRPPGYAPTPAGERVELPPALRADPARYGRPTLLHFYNPDCPCSRFSLTHVRELVAAFGDRVRFVAVGTAEPGGEGPSRAGGVPAELSPLDGLRVLTLPDPNRRLADACGVYSTPQAVILDTGGRLLFRGNYNTSRYCPDRRTQFARLALEALLRGEPVPPMPEAATVSYGCALPPRRPTPAPEGRPKELP